MAGHHTHFSRDSYEQWFEFTPEAKKKLIMGILAGVAMLALGVFLLSNGWGIGLNHASHEAGHAVTSEHHGLSAVWQRVVANVWLNGVLFSGISVVGMFFICYQYLAWAGWSSSLKRVPEAFPAFLPYTGIVLLVIYLVFGHEIFHWRHEGIIDPSNHHYDAVLAGKSGYLNHTFYLVRLVGYFVVWFGLWKMMRKNSVLEDQLGGDEHWYKMKNIARAFILFFAVTSTTAAWDWVMSIDSHWFSTMFGWYTLASWHVTGLAVIMLTIVYLKEKGYLAVVNENHLHDLAKLIFGFSIFWTYVWFSQFLLIYYANLSEETIYFIERFSGYNGIYKGPFFLNLFLNFVFPFLVLMTRDAKRNTLFLKIAAWGIILGHYIDFYNNIMPGVVGANGNFGLIEAGTVVIFACSFAYIVLNELTKASLVAKNHPMLEEAVHHDI